MCISENVGGTYCFHEYFLPFCLFFFFLCNPLYCLISPFLFNDYHRYDLVHFCTLRIGVKLPTVCADSLVRFIIFVIIIFFHINILLPLFAGAHSFLPMARNTSTARSQVGNRGAQSGVRGEAGLPKRGAGPSVKKNASHTPHSAPSTSSSMLQHSMQAAVAEALFPEVADRRRAVKGSDSADEYGKGAPTDRLQFGYAPAIAEEAMCFHTRIPASKWVQDRVRIGKLVFKNHQKNPVPHFEPISSALKLRDHWKKQSVLQANYRGGGTRGALDAEKYEGLLELFASNQRLT